MQRPYNLHVSCHHAVTCRVLVNGYSLNHTALSVHQIAGRAGDIYSYANELVMKGFKMNETGGIMKVGCLHEPWGHALVYPTASCCSHGMMPMAACMLRQAHKQAAPRQCLRGQFCIYRECQLPMWPVSLCMFLQVSPDSGLLQCSTVADLVDFQFADGEVRKQPLD